MFLSIRDRSAGTRCNTRAYHLLLSKPRKAAPIQILILMITGQTLVKAVSLQVHITSSALTVRQKLRLTILSRMFPMWRTRCHRLLILSFTVNTKRYIPPIRILSYLSLVAYSTVLKVNMERGRSYMQPHRPIESLYPDTLTTILFGFEACIFLRHGVSGIAGHSGSIPIRQGFRDTADRNLVSI